ncbi:MAG TPA: hypothetical protein VFA76_12965 [Terriglobales bacterium]|nr:hypothetical protein [Terriglobales bacterium]
MLGIDFGAFEPLAKAMKKQLGMIEQHLAPGAETEDALKELAAAASSPGASNCLMRATIHGKTVLIFAAG